MAGARRLENEIRVGLERSELQAANHVAAMPVDPLEIVSFGKTARRHVREFGTLFAGICLGVAGWKLYREQGVTAASYWFVPGALFAILGWIAPRALLPVWRAWMKFAHYLSVVMTAILLCLTWCIGFLPMALVLRTVGIKRMDMSFRSGRQSYWETRDPKYDDFKRLKLQY